MHFVVLCIVQVLKPKHSGCKILFGTLASEQGTHRHMHINNYNHRKFQLGFEEKSLPFEVISTV